MAKRNQNKPGASSPTQPVWATAVISIEENKKQKGLELRFNAEPSPILQSKLRAKDFRHSRQKTMWYGDMTQAARDFADLLKAVLPDDPKGPQLSLLPSADPVRANLEKKEFSFVMISLANGSVRSYIIFEPSKPKAEVIASNFAQKRFKDQFISLAVFPRARLKEARLLFESNLVIDPGQADEISKEPDPVHKTEDSKSVNYLPKADIIQPGVLMEKIPMKLIELGVKEGLISVDYDQGVHFETFAATDDHVKRNLIGWLSDVYFRITWEDDEILEGSIDLEPPSFYNDKPAPFSWFVNHYFTYLSKQEPSVLNSQKRIDHAKLMLAHYWLEDKPDRTLVDTAKPAEDPTKPPAANQRQLEHEVLQTFYKWAVQQKDEYSKPSELTKDQLSAWFKENRSDLDQATIERIWQSHVRVTKTMNRLTKRDSGKTGSQPYSSIYKKLHKIIPGLVDHIKAGKRHGKSRMDPEGGLMDLSLDFDGYDKDGNPTIALSHYFIQEGDPIADPDMKIRLLPAMEMAEAMALQDQFGYKQVYEERDGKTYVNLAEKKSQNKFLSYWLSNLIQQGHKIDLMDGDTQVKMEAGEENALEDAPEENVLSLLSKFIPGLRQPSNITRRFESVYTSDAVQQIILASVSPDGVDSFNIYFDDTIDQNIQLQADVSLSLTEPRVAVKSLWLSPEYVKSFGDTTGGNSIHQAFTRWLSSLVKKGRSMVRVIDDTMLLNKDSSGDNPSETKRIEPFDAFVMAQLIASDGYLDKAWSIKFDREVLTKSSFTADEKDNLLAMYNIYVFQDRFMQEAYNATYSERHGMQEPLPEIEPGKKISNSKHVDLVVEDRQLPNVLVPTGTREPFLSSTLNIEGWRKQKTEFPHLLKLKEEDISTIAPLAMFELMQFSHPDDYGIDVSRSALIEEWEKRGERIFNELGFPTDLNYPYANLYLGYQSVESLGSVLHEYNKERIKWWSVAEGYRPIADIQKGLEIIDELNLKFVAERGALVNPKTGKPKQEHKEKARDIDFAIRNLDESRAVILAYQEAQGPIQTGRSDKDPLATEDGVYTWQSAGEHMETLRIDMPKTAGYTATVYLVKTSTGEYKEGISFSKSFGDHTGASSFPSVQDESYPTRKSALKAALLHHEQELQRTLHTEDVTLNNEATKKSKLNQAMKALYQFAKEQGISMEAKPDPTDKNDGIIQGLENAYWTVEDNRYPQDKVSILGSEFHQARLREAIRNKLEKLPLPRLQEIADYLRARFQEQRPLESYEKSMVTIGKTGDKRKKVLIAYYADDIIRNNDLNEKTEYPVMSFLLELLFIGEARLVDVPLKDTAPNSENKKSVKKQSQYELNKEIEAMIDQKDKGGAYYNEEEKNYLRQYTGSGGLLSEGASGSGTLYEFYTPDALVKKMWDLAFHYGYDGGRILEPSVGTGNFLKYAPKGAIVFGFETNHYAARIAQVLYPNAHIHEKAFETHFFTGNIHLKDKFENPGYSLVIGNPPYGDFTGKYAGLGEKRYTGVVEYDQYFTLRGLDLMKPGGLMVFLVPSYFMLSKQKYNTIKEKIMAKADLIDCYRLPGGSIPHTDVGTDILVWRKRH